MTRNKAKKVNKKEKKIENEIVKKGITKDEIVELKAVLQANPSKLWKFLQKNAT